MYHGLLLGTLPCSDDKHIICDTFAVTSAAAGGGCAATIMILWLFLINEGRWLTAR
jgi:hypothetical protein